MKIEGKDLSKLKNVIIPIVRGDEDIIFQASCITDFTVLEKVLKEPQPPVVIRRGNKLGTPDYNDKDYKAAMEKFSSDRIDWMVATSLLATQGLSWETVDFMNPDTFCNYKKELADAGFNDFQIGSMIKGVMEANGLSDSRVREARDRFLAGQPENRQNSPMEEPSNS